MIGARRHDGHVSYASAQVRGAVRASPVGKDRYHPSDHSGLAVAEWPNLAVSPNEMFAVGIAKAGMLRLPAAPELVFEFLGVAWRIIQHYGVEIDGRRYNGPALNGHRNETSPYRGVAAGKWPIRVNDDDVRFVYFQEPVLEPNGEPGGGSWHRLDWEHTPMLNTPFSAEAARYARALVAKTDRFADPNTTLAQVLARWSTGEVTDRRERRIAARLSAERAAIPGLGGGWPIDLSRYGDAVDMYVDWVRVFEPESS